MHEESGQNQTAQIPVNRLDATNSTSSQNLSTQPSADSLLRLHRNFSEWFDNIWNDLNSPLSSSSLSNHHPLPGSSIGDFRAQLDVSGNNEQYQINLEVPGLKESDLNIEISNHVLTISGHKEDQQENKDNQFYRIERSYGSFQRTLALPEDANAEHINANLKDGVLTISIPRQEVTGKDVKKINIISN